jgi:hypothetical protein
MNTWHCLKTAFRHTAAWLTLLLLIIVSLAEAQTTPAPSRKIEPNLLVLEVRLDQHVLSDAIIAYQCGPDILLPLGELSRLLTIAIKTQPEQGIASGFILREERSFSLNLAPSTVTLEGKTEAIDPALIMVEPYDIYVARRLISDWLPLDLKINMSRLSLQVQPREPLPLQLRLERERLGAMAGSRGYTDHGYPYHDTPYRLLDTPFIDQSLGVDYRSSNGNGQVDVNYTTYLTADLLGMESELFANSSSQESSSEFRFTLGRHDPNAGLLGPLHASSFVFGNVPVPGVDNIAFTSTDGDGVTLSNRPLTQSTSFDRHSLQGDLPPGWDITLYHNNVLVGFQQSRPDGKFNFDDQPLIYGPNEFRMVFNGPLGQLRVERQSFLLEQSLIRPGEFYYSLTENRDTGGRQRSVAQFDWGLGKHFTATGGVVRLPVEEQEQRYINLGLRTFWRSMILSTDFVAESQSGGSLAEVGLKTRIRGFVFDMSHAQLNDFTSDLFMPGSDPVRARQKIRIDGAIPLNFLPRLQETLEVKRDYLQSGTKNIEVSERLSTNFNGTSLTNHLRWHSFGSTESTNGSLLLSRRVAGIGLRGQMSYTLSPESKLSALSLVADKNMSACYRLNIGLTHSFDNDETQYTAGLSKSLGRYGLSINSSYLSSGYFSTNVRLFVAMGRRPRKAGWLVDARPMANTGAASVCVFLDSNLNGVMDSGEESIENVAFTVNGGSRHPARTDANGIAYLERLPVKQNVDIVLDTATLEDPQWVPQIKGMRLIPRLGRVAELYFPVMMTSEIDGTVYLVEKDAKRGMGDMLLELVDGKHNVVARAKSVWDGFYIVTAVLPGNYLLRISPQQLKQLNLTDPGTRKVEVSPDGTFVNGVDFFITAEKRPTEQEEKPPTGAVLEENQRQ